MNDMNEQREREKYFAMLTFLEGIVSSLLLCNPRNSKTCISHSCLEEYIFSPRKHILWLRSSE